MILSVGSKVFLMGEYLALKGGPSLLATLEPRFQLKVYSAVDAGQLYGIHEESPAGIFYKKNQNFFKNYQMQFSDPHGGRGGWGASSAQFALLASFYYGHQSIINNAEWDLDLQCVDKEYLDITKKMTKSGLPPSGLDVIAQLRGGLSYIDRGHGRIENKIWPFNDFTFLLFHTGIKVATHTHLAQVQNINFEVLETCMQEFVTAFTQLNVDKTIQYVNEYRNLLHDQNLEASSTTEWIRKIQGLPGVLATKGCGALGADVILVFVETRSEIEIQKKLEEMGVNNVLTRYDLTDQVQVNFEWCSKDFITQKPNTESVNKSPNSVTASNLNSDIYTDINANINKNSNSNMNTNGEA